MKTKIIEFQDVLGGKIHIYPEKMIWDIGGLRPLTGAQLIEQLTKQGLTFEPEVVLGEKVVQISRRADGTFVLQCASGQEHFSRTVILAVGSGILQHQKLEVEGASRYEVANLHYTVQSLQRFQDKVVLISGGGNSAVDWANELERIAKKVYLVYRGNRLNGLESHVSQLLNSSVECHFQSSITKLLAGPYRDAIEAVELTNLVTGIRTVVAVDEVIVNHGFTQDTSLLRNSNLNIRLDQDGYVDGTARSETSVPGLYAAGDILRHPGKLQLIAGAFQDAANAVNQAKQYIEPGAAAQAMVSSHNEIFRERNRAMFRRMFQLREH